MYVYDDRPRIDGSDIYGGTGGIHGKGAKCGDILRNRNRRDEEIAENAEHQEKGVDGIQWIWSDDGPARKGEQSQREDQ